MKTQISLTLRFRLEAEASKYVKIKSHKRVVNGKVVKVRSHYRNSFSVLKTKEF